MAEGYDFLVSFPGLGINDIGINRVAFTIGGISIYWYGVLIALAVLLCMVLATKQSKKFGIDPDFVLDNFLVIIITMIIGARLYYVAFTWDDYKNDLLSIFDTRKGGLAFYGGVIGALLGIIIYHKIKKKKVEPFLDFIVVYVPLGQAIGRIGNFINQEAFGTNTDLPWGMISNGTTSYLAANPQLGQDPNLPVHPTFLYEFIGNMILFGVLLKFRKTNKVPYATVAMYLLGYGIIRFFVEGIRTDALFIGNTNIRISQLLSAAMVVVALLYLFLMRKQRRAEQILSEDKVFESAAVSAAGGSVGSAGSAGSGEVGSAGSGEVDVSAEAGEAKAGDETEADESKTDIETEADDGSKTDVETEADDETNADEPMTDITSTDDAEAEHSEEVEANNNAAEAEGESSPKVDPLDSEQVIDTEKPTSNTDSNAP